MVKYENLIEKVVYTKLVITHNFVFQTKQKFQALADSR